MIVSAVLAAAVLAAGAPAPDAALAGRDRADSPPRTVGPAARPERATGRGVTAGRVAVPRAGGKRP